MGVYLHISSTVWVEWDMLLRAGECFTRGGLRVQLSKESSPIKFNSRGAPGEMRKVSWFPNIQRAVLFNWGWKNAFFAEVAQWLE